MQTTQVFLVRHGETEWNLVGKMQGHSDSPLTAVGIAQADALADGMKNQKFSALYSSDLVRAYETARRIATKNHLTIITDNRLRERNLGIFQGLDKQGIAVQFPDEYQQYITDGANYVVPNGESGQQFFDRCVICLTELAQKHPGERILVVTHGGVLANLFKSTVGLSVASPRRFAVLNTSINVFAYHNGMWTLERWGDLSHLEHLRSLDDF